MKIALTGGIACGKSLFSQMLNARGVETLDADAVVHALEASGGAGVAPIMARFGEEVRAPDGGIDRRALAARVFGSENAAARQDLESILHPLVREALQSFAAIPSPAPRSPHQAPGTRHQAPGTSLRLVEIPLLYECRWEGDYDAVCALVSSPAQQVARLMETRGLGRAEAEARLAAQLPVAEKAARADYVVWNDSTLEHLQDEAEKFVAWVKGKFGV